MKGRGKCGRGEEKYDRRGREYRGTGEGGGGTGLPSRKGEKPHGKGCAKRKFSVPDIEAGCCQGPEGNGVSSGKGVKGGLAPQEAGKISSQCSARAGTTWARTRRTGQDGRDEGGSVRTE
jgi:hypothetical protein